MVSERKARGQGMMIHERSKGMMRLKMGGKRTLDAFYDVDD